MIFSIKVDFFNKCHWHQGSNYLLRIKKHFFFFKSVRSKFLLLLESIIFHPLVRNRGHEGGRLISSIWVSLTRVASLQNSHRMSGGDGSSPPLWPRRFLWKIQFWNWRRAVWKFRVATSLEKVSTLQAVDGRPTAWTSAVIDSDREINIHKDDWSQWSQEAKCLRCLLQNTVRATCENVKNTSNTHEEARYLLNEKN